MGRAVLVTIGHVIQPAPHSRIGHGHILREAGHLEARGARHVEAAPQVMDEALNLVLASRPVGAAQAAVSGEVEEAGLEAVLPCHHSFSVHAVN